MNFTIQKLEGKIAGMLNIADGATRDAIEIAESAAKAGIIGLSCYPMPSSLVIAKP